MNILVHESLCGHVSISIEYIGVESYNSFILSFLRNHGRGFWMNRKGETVSSE